MSVCNGYSKELYSIGYKNKYVIWFGFIILLGEDVMYVIKKVKDNIRIKLYNIIFKIN